MNMQPEFNALPFELMTFKAGGLQPVSVQTFVGSCRRLKIEVAFRDLSTFVSLTHSQIR